VDGFRLPGYDVEQLVGIGASGQVWRAREQASGQLVALKRLHVVGGPAPASAVAERRLHREAALLAALRHPHVVRLRAVVSDPEGPVLVMDYAAGGSLASVLRSRGTLSPGEVVTLGVPLAQALAELHARDLIHGDVSPANIVFDARGKPMLADLGMARLVSEAVATAGATPGFVDPALLDGAAATPPCDVYGLAAACHAALAGAPPDPGGGTSLRSRCPRAPDGLIEAIASGLDPRQRSRPEAARLAVALYGSCTPHPLRLPAPPAEPERSEPTRRIAVRPSTPREPSVPQTVPEPASGRRVLRLLRRPALLLIPVGVLAAAIAGVGWAARDRPPRAQTNTAARTDPAPPAAVDRRTSPPAPSFRTTAASPTGPAPAAVPPAAPPVAASTTSATTGTDWVTIMAELDALRDQAFVDDDPAKLARVYLATSPAFAADRQALAALVALGGHAVGLRLHVASVAVTTRTPTRVVLDVRDVLPGYDIALPDGAVRHETGRGERRWAITLRQVGGAAAGWRIETVAALPG
jgi:serine/threonine protein kinase